jgi:hypothetical protein
MNKYLVNRVEIRVKFVIEISIPSISPVGIRAHRDNPQQGKLLVNIFSNLMIILKSRDGIKKASYETLKNIIRVMVPYHAPDMDCSVACIIKVYDRKVMIVNYTSVCSIDYDHNLQS